MTLFRYQFVPAGTVAPSHPPDNEIWLDVGNRAGPQVLDHHGGDTNALSASELVWNCFDQLVQPYLSIGKPVTLTLHTKPDLDAICAAWLVTHYLNNSLSAELKSVLSPLIERVSTNDQGMIQTQDPATCWTIVFAERMRSELPHMAGDEVSSADENRVRFGFSLLDQTLAGLARGESLEDTTKGLITPAVTTSLAESEHLYRQDLGNGTQFQVYLPTHKAEIPVNHQPINPPSVTTANSRLADGLYLKNPSCSLFRELARGDKKGSQLGQGFSFLVVQSDWPRHHLPRPLSRYVLSTNPATHFHLQGLGKMLEQREQDFENQQEEDPLLSGRERVGLGEGRHGYNVASPWYDGRGHNFTIIDCPGVVVEEQTIYASALSATEIQATIQAYGDLFSPAEEDSYGDQPEKDSAE